MTNINMTKNRDTVPEIVIFKRNITIWYDIFAYHPPLILRYLYPSLKSFEVLQLLFARLYNITPGEILGKS